MPTWVQAAPLSRLGHCIKVTLEVSQLKGLSAPAQQHMQQQHSSTWQQHMASNISMLQQHESASHVSAAHIQACTTTAQ